jgi:RNase P subunit RPR2
MKQSDEKVFKKIIAFAIKYPEKLARNIYVRSDHARHHDHNKTVTLVVEENKENILKSSARLRCGDCDAYLYNIGFDDIARAFADAQVKACRYCGTDARIAEMCNGASGSQWLVVQCKNINCGIIMHTGIGTVSNYEHYHVEKRHANRMRAVEKWNGKTNKVKTEPVEALFSI